MRSLASAGYEGWPQSRVRVWLKNDKRGNESRSESRSGSRSESEGGVWDREGEGGEGKEGGSMKEVRVRKCEREGVQEGMWRCVWWKGREEVEVEVEVEVDVDGRVGCGVRREEFPSISELLEEVPRYCVEGLRCSRWRDAERCGEMW